jgi:hypothetical protein
MNILSLFTEDDRLHIQKYEMTRLEHWQQILCLNAGLPKPV